MPENDQSGYSLFFKIIYKIFILDDDFYVF